MDNRIYLDNAAASRTDPEVLRAMLPFFDEIYAVASSQFSHTPGILAREALDRSRETIARRLSASPDEIVFTSGGTESNNLAVKGAAWAAKGGKRHLICSAIEHQSVLHSCQWLEKQGFSLTTVRVDQEGFVDLGHLDDSIRPDTLLVSIQQSNQEVGTIQPLDRIAGICRRKGVLFHTDASFSFTQADLDLSAISADLVTLSAHRIHGPKGIGALFVRKGTPIEKMMHGGYHEFNLRSGTENVAGAAGFARAVELSGAGETARIRALGGRLFERLGAAVGDIEINGPRDMERRLPGNVNVSFKRVEGESVVLHLDMKGISVITGSACFSRSLEPSYVMMAMGFSHERAHGSIRFTLSRFNTEQEIDRTAESCRDVVEALRRISPLSK